MLGFELGKELTRRADMSLFRIFQALTDAFPCVGAGGNVEQVLKRRSVRLASCTVRTSKRNHVFESRVS
jgi:hypothetical protein